MQLETFYCQNIKLKCRKVICLLWCSLQYVSTQTFCFVFSQYLHSQTAFFVCSLFFFLFFILFHCLNFRLQSVKLFYELFIESIYVMYRSNRKGKEKQTKETNKNKNVIKFRTKENHSISSQRQQIYERRRLDQFSQMLNIVCPV